MDIKLIQSLFAKHKVSCLGHRYITANSIKPLIKELEQHLEINIVGESVLGNSIHGIKIGSGSKKILLWSQMHGNETTTTKAVFDLLNSFLKEDYLKYILKTCSLYIIPILNPDGAFVYTRVNANKVDLNRDAQALSQPESRVLMQVFETFKPDYCYNLHGQRTIFSAGNTNKPATVSFLSPAQDKTCTVTSNRKISMEVIGVMNTVLQEIIPNQVGVYDDAFNLNCVGDTFQSKCVPTILFEAGHYYNDYEREKTREYIYISLLTSLNYIAKNTVDGSMYKSYFEIPENKDCFLDVIIRKAKVEDKILDIGIMFRECLVNNEIKFIPKVKKIAPLNNYYGHKEFNANKLRVLNGDGVEIKVGDENDFVIMNNDKIVLF